jgi:hypothetical protein
MQDNETRQPADTLEEPGKPRSSKVILEALDHAEREFRGYNELCKRIDSIYSARQTNGAVSAEIGLGDQEYDTFWASMEVLKPAIYAKPPQVVAKPRFSDATPADKVVAELIERVVNSEFERSGIDMHMREVRDDLALLNRGVLWVTYEAKDGRKSVCVDHVDRLDYRHEPVRYWPELGWQARCAWMTERQMRDRFQKHSGDEYTRASFVTRDSRDDDFKDDSAKAPVWEVWSKADNRVYWVSEGCDIVLDEGEPHLDLRDFYPSPRPAYGTLRRRTLSPVPDYIRYEVHLEQINELTARIYGLLKQVKLRGLMPSGGDVGDALQTAMSSADDMILIPVPGASLMAGGGEYVQWIPLDMLANTITGLISARTQLFADFDRLSGISDIMRGETEADETLGAQRIKTQYGSVRVKDKTEEVIRLARDAARVAVEVICDKFDKDTLLEVSQMVIPSKSDVERDIAAIKKAAQEEMKALGEKAKEALGGGQQIDPAQAQQALQQGQQQIAEKWAPRLQELSNTVVIEDVMAIIKDRRDRALIIDIETDSTVMVDEAMEKQSRSEMFQAVTGSFGALPQFAAMGEQGIKLFGALVNFTLQPYTGGNRAIQSQIDELIEQAPEIAAKMAAAQGEGDDAAGLAEANKTLAEAEQMKAQAAMAAVQSKSELAQADGQRKMVEMQQKAAESERKYEIEIGKLQAQMVATADKQAGENAKREADVDKIRAEIAVMLEKLGLDIRKQDLDEYTAASNEQARVVDQQMQAVGSEREHARAERGEERADRGQDLAERSTDREFEMREQGTD